MKCRSLAITFRYVPPRRAYPQPPEDAIDHSTIINPSHSTALVRQNWCKNSQLQRGTDLHMAAWRFRTRRHLCFECNEFLQDTFGTLVDQRAFMAKAPLEEEQVLFPLVGLRASSHRNRCH